MIDMKLHQPAGALRKKLPHEVWAIAEDATILGLILLAAASHEQIAERLLGEHVPDVITILLKGSLWAMAAIYAVSVAGTLLHLIRERLFAGHAVPAKREAAPGMPVQSAAHAEGISVLVVDDDQLAIRAVTASLDRDPRIGLVLSANSPEEALGRIRFWPQSGRPDVILIDVNFTDQARTGIEALPEVREAAPGSHVVVMSVSREADTVRRALVAQADGFVWKNESALDFAEAVVDAAQENFVASRSIAREVIESI